MDNFGHCTLKTEGMLKTLKIDEKRAVFIVSAWSTPINVKHTEVGSKGAPLFEPEVWTRPYRKSILHATMLNRYCNSPQLH